MSVASSTTQRTSGLSQFIFLKPRWLVKSVKSILRHDLISKIDEIRLELKKKRLGECLETNKNRPLITAEDAYSLWQNGNYIKKSSESTADCTNKITFDFLYRLLVRFGVFVPIDLNIEKVSFGGEDYGLCDKQSSRRESSFDTVDLETLDKVPRFFFLPCLLSDVTPEHLMWTYKTEECWKVTVCHSFLFPDGVPPGLMERITAAVLSDIYSATRNEKKGERENKEQLSINRILCWRTTFLLELQLGHNKTEILCHLADRDSKLCVASEKMTAGMKRLILSGRGHRSDGARYLYNGGYFIVFRAIERVMYEYSGCEYETDGVCPDCLQKNNPSEVHTWDWNELEAAAYNGEKQIRCNNGHKVDKLLVTGNSKDYPQLEQSSHEVSDLSGSKPTKAVMDLIRGVVLVGLWDADANAVIAAGSGFVVDKNRGLIVTASHTLMNIDGYEKTPYGTNYHGYNGRVVIGVIPRSKGETNVHKTTAVFRYFGEIVTKDENMEEHGVCHVDACIVRITTRIERDVDGDGSGCAGQPEILLNNKEVMKGEKLKALKYTETYQVEEHVRILGYNQGGEGLLGPGEHLNRTADFSVGQVLRDHEVDEEGRQKMRSGYKPLKEIVVRLPSIGGHSGGPCVNDQGDVIGILCRADRVDKQRCYLVPVSEWMPLLEKSKKRD